MAFTKDPCAGARGGTDVTITLIAVYRRVADGNKDPRPKAVGVFLDRHLSLTLGDKWKEAWKVDGPFCSSGKRRGKWIPLLLASGEGRGARNSGEGRGARGGPESGWPLPLHFEEKPLLEGQKEILRGPESPANPCHSLPSPDRGDRGARPRFAPVAPPELERPYAVVSPVPGADAPRLRTVALSELGDLLSPPSRKTCAGRRRTALRSRSRAGQRAEGSTAY
jgi:hypothetical protein